MILQGFLTAIASAGISCVTTLPAPIIEFSPIQTLSPIKIGNPSRNTQLKSIITFLDR